MVENLFYHEDLVLNVDHSNRVIHCGHVEGEALLEANISTDVTDSTERFDEDNSSETLIIAPKQFGDKSSEHDDTIDNMFLDDDNQLENGYFDGPFKGNIYVRWNSSYYRNTDEFNNLTLTFDDHIEGDNLIKLDRYHQLSDVVKHTFTAKVGIISKIRKKACAEIIGVNKLLVDIDCLKLKNIEKFYPGTSEQLVIYNSWLGRVTSILRDVILKFPDGARIRTSDATLENFEPIFNINLPEIIFKGSTLKGDARDLKGKSTKFLVDTRHINPTWLKQLKQKQVVEVMIVKVIISSAKVDWLMYKPINNIPQSDVEIPPTVIKGSNVQNLKSVHTNPFLFCYTGDIWYYQLKQSDKVYNINDEYTVAKLLYKIFMKENMNNLKYVIKPNKATKPKYTNGIVEKKSDKIVIKKNNVKGIIKYDMKLKPENSTSKIQTNHNYRSIHKEEEDKIMKKSQSIYPHLQYRCRRNPALFRSNYLTLDKKQGKQSRLQKKEVKFQNSSNRENLASTLSLEDHKTTSGVDQRLRVPVSKSPKKINVQTQKITTEMVINFLGNLTVGTWVPIHLILLESLLDVAWQDGTMAHRIPSVMFVPEMYDLDEYDFFPGDFVSLKKPREENHLNDDNSYNSSFGCIVKSRNYERIVTVQWFQINTDKVCTKFGKSEQCGSYDIRHHKKHHYHVGDIVAISPTCDKTTFPAGYVNSVQPNRGRLSIRWHNSRETFLHPLDLYGIVWDIVSDDLFASSEESLDVSSLNLHDEIDDKRFEQVSSNTNKDSINSLATIPLVRQILKKIEKIRENFPIPNQIIKPGDEIDNEILNEIKKDLLELKNSCSEKSIQLIYESFLLSGFNTNYDHRNINLESLVGQQLPSTSTLTDSDILPAHIEAMQKIRRKIKKENTKDVDEEYLLQDIIMNKILNLNKSLTNWLNINALTEPHMDQNKKVNFPNTVPNVSLENSKQRDGSLSTKIQTMKENCSKEFDHSVSLCDEEDLQLHFRQTIETNDPISYDPLPIELLGFFDITGESPENHKFVKQTQVKGRSHHFSKAWTRDYNLLTTSLPKGIWIRNYEQRIDLFSVMIEGPVGTPYQYTLFFFDIHIPPEYPDQPPLVHYISLTNDRINPNLYPDGRVCLSLLGTWIGKGTENWDPKISNLLQIIISIQGLILVVDPYYNEAGFDRRRGSLDGLASSQRFNESIITSMVVAMIHLINYPIKVFVEQIRNYYKEIGNRYVSLLKFWATLDETTLKTYQDKHKTSITIETTSAITKGICDNSLKNSRNSDLVTYVASMWSEVDTLAIDSVDNIKKDEINDPLCNVHPKKVKPHKLSLPDFNLAPVSQGFSLTLNKYTILLEKSMYKNYL